MKIKNADLGVASVKFRKEKVENKQIKFNIDGSSPSSLPNSNAEVCSTCDEITVSKWITELEHEEEYQSHKIDKQAKFYTDLRKWALGFNIPQTALKNLFSIVNDCFGNVIPKDPRTLLQTHTNISIVEIAPNQFYWHQGLEY